MPVLALDLAAPYPWEAAIALSAAFALAPFVMARYRSADWKIPHWHYLVILAVVAIQVYFYFRYERSVHTVERTSYLWENEQFGPMLVGPDHREPVPYTSASRILPEFLLLTSLPALFCLAVSFALRGCIRAMKRRGS